MTCDKVFKRDPIKDLSALRKSLKADLSCVVGGCERVRSEDGLSGPEVSMSDHSTRILAGGGLHTTAPSTDKSPDAIPQSICGLRLSRVISAGPLTGSIARLAKDDWTN